MKFIFILLNFDFYINRWYVLNYFIHYCIWSYINSYIAAIADDWRDKYFPCFYRIDNFILMCLLRVMVRTTWLVACGFCSLVRSSLLLSGLISILHSGLLVLYWYRSFSSSGSAAVALLSRCLGSLFPSSPVGREFFCRVGVHGGVSSELASVCSRCCCFASNRFLRSKRDWRREDIDVVCRKVQALNNYSWVSHNELILTYYNYDLSIYR